MKKIRLTALTMAGLMAAASMTGCGAKTAETTAASETTTAAGTMAAETTTVAETTGKVSQTKPLVVYLNDFDDIIPEMFKKATGYDVEVVAGNGAETLARIETRGTIHSGISYGWIPCQVSTLSERRECFSQTGNHPMRETSPISLRRSFRRTRHTIRPGHTRQA